MSAVNLHTVCQVLGAALSDDANQRKQSEATLEQLSTCEGYCSCLLDVLHNGGVADSTKWLAAVQLKNTVKHRWSTPSIRSNQSTAISDAEKAHVRAHILQLITVKDHKLALQLAVVVARIARHDFPRTWPTLFDELLQRLTQARSDDHTARRVWLTLHHVIKELSTKRLPSDQRTFQQVSSSLIGHVWGSWASDSQILSTHLPAALTPGATPPPEVTAGMEQWMLTLKILRRLLRNGLSKDVQTLEPQPWVCQALPALLTMLQQLLRARHPAPKAAHRVHVMLESCILKLLKGLCGLLDVHPWAFDSSNTLTAALSICTDVVGRAHYGGLSWSKILTRAMRFVSLVMQSPSYAHNEQLVTLRPPAGSDDAAMAERWQQLCAAVEAKLQEFWGCESRLQRLMEAIIQLHLPLSQDEMEAWQEDPENWFHVHEGALSEDDPRAVTEALLHDVIVRGAGSLDPMLADAVRLAQRTLPAAELAAVSGPLSQDQVAALRHKEAIYCAACVAAYELGNTLDFPSWLQRSLLPELSVNLPHTWILRRRCMRCIAEWVANLDRRRDLLPTVYAAMVEALQSTSGDVCLQLTAIDTLHALVSDWSFNENDFVPVLQPFLAQIPGILQLCTSFDSHTKVFLLVSTLVERLGDLVHPHASTIMGWLPLVWQHSEGQSLLRMQVLELLQRLVHALGLSSPTTYPVTLSVLDYALDPAGPEALNLVEGALLLYLVVLRNAPDGALTALQLWPRWVSIMAQSIEFTATCMQIACSCVLLGGSAFLQEHGASLADALGHAVGDVKSEVMVFIYTPMLQMLQCFGGDAVQLLNMPLLKTLQCLLRGEESVHSWAKGMALFARMLVHCPDAVLPFVTSAAAHGIRPGGSDAQQQTAASSSLFEHFLGEWLDRFDSIAAPADRKLCAMAFARALTLPEAGVLSHLELIVVNVGSVVTQLEGTGEPGYIAYDYDIYVGMSEARDDLAGFSTAESIMSEEAEGEIRRKQRLTEADVVRNTKLLQWTKDCMLRAHEVHGPDLQSAAHALPGTVSEQLQALMR